MKQNTSEQDTSEKIGTFASLRIHNFRMLFAGTTLSNAAQWIQQIALGWLIYDITGSGTILGTVNLVRSIAALSMIPIAGILIDTLKRRNLMMINNTWLLVVTAGFGLILLLGFDQMVYVFLFAILGGIVGTVDNTLRQVIVFDLLPRHLTPNGMALIQTGWSLMRSFGPTLGSFLLLWLGAGGNFMVQAGAYALIIFTIIKIHFPERTSATTIKSSPIKNIKEGIKYIKNERVTRTIMMLGFVLPLLIIPIFTILPPIYAVEIFGDESGKILGFLMASVGLGGIFGGFVTASLGRMERRGLLQLGSLFLLSLSLIGFALSNVLAISLLFLVLSGFFEIIFLTTNQTLLQLSIPDDLRGRVTSVVNLNMALQPLGGLIAGAGSDLLGGPKMITIVMAGLAALAVVIVLFISPTIRNYRLSQAIRPDSS
ncbi:MAG TPA: MFS transporter [Dehalococcoidia bacterium]|nr:MFS transporter [Dehalococcoidia bacterium]